MLLLYMCHLIILAQRFEKESSTVHLGFDLKQIATKGFIVISRTL